MRQLEHFPNLVAMFFARAKEMGDAPFLWAKKEGEWRSTKKWLRADYTDINEAECILQYNEHLPGTQLGSETAKERGQTELKGVPNGQ